MKTSVCGNPVSFCAKAGREYEKCAKVLREVSMEYENFTKVLCGVNWEGRCLSGRQPPRKSALRIVRGEFRTLFNYLKISLCEAGKFYCEINYFICEITSRLLRDKFFYLRVEFLLLPRELSSA